MYKEINYKVFSGITAVFFLALSLLVYFKSSIVYDLNQYFYNVVINSSTYEYNNFWRFVTTFGSFAVLSFLTLCVSVYSYFYSKNYLEAKVYITSMIGGGLFVLIVKQLTASNRPSSVFAIEQSFSFPSGHTALAAIFAIVTGYYIIRDKRKGHKKPILAFVILYVLLIALSRLMLGEHWFIDILGGVLIALSWSTAVIFYFKSKSRK